MQTWADRYVHDYSYLALRCSTIMYYPGCKVTIWEIANIRSFLLYHILHPCLLLQILRLLLTIAGVLAGVLALPSTGAGGEQQ